jgi:tRNA(fMet)-specific endonuclease VapC
MHQVGISAVTEGELRFGAVRLPSATRPHALVEEFLIRVVVHPWDSAAAKAYADLRFRLERDGKTLGNLDMIIAAHALASGRVLVTHDRALARVRGLDIENWTKL